MISSDYLLLKWKKFLFIYVQFLITGCFIVVASLKMLCFYQCVATFNPFDATDLFWYPLKTSENQRFPDVFGGYQKRSVAWNGLIMGPSKATAWIVGSIEIYLVRLVNSDNFLFTNFILVLGTVRWSFRNFEPDDGDV